MYTRVLYFVLKALYYFGTFLCSLDPRHRIYELPVLFGRQKLRGNAWEVKEATLKQSAEIDFRILGWTVHVLREGDEQGRVFEAIPGFFRSDEVNVLRDQAPKLIEDALGYFLRDTLSSNSVPESVKIHRLMTCLNAAGEVLPPVLNTLRNMFGEMIRVNWG